MVADNNFLQNNQQDSTNEEQAIEPLNFSDETPFNAAKDVGDRPSEEDPASRTTKNPMNDSHPTTDTSVDSDELYQEGLRAASGAGQANRGESTDVPPTSGLPNIADADHS